MKEKVLNIVKLLLCFLSFYYMGDIIVYIIKLFGIEKVSDSILLLIQLICGTLITLILILCYKKEILLDLNKIKEKTNKFSIGYILKMFLLFMVVKFLISFISVAILMLCGLDVENINSVNQTTIESFTKISPFIMIISTSILAPIYEEVLFRLGIKKTIKNKTLFVIVSGSIFGLLHIFPLAEGITLTLGLIQSITYVTMGIFLAIVYVKTDNIFNTIGIHFLNNFLSILVMINTM